MTISVKDLQSHFDSMAGCCLKHPQPVPKIKFAVAWVTCCKIAGGDCGDYHDRWGIAIAVSEDNKYLVLKDEEDSSGHG